MVVRPTSKQRSELRQIPTNNDIEKMPMAHLRQITTFHMRSRLKLTFFIKQKNFKVFLKKFFEIFKTQLTLATHIRLGLYTVR